MVNTSAGQPIYKILIPLSSRDRFTHGREVSNRNLSTNILEALVGTAISAHICLLAVGIS